MLSACKKGQTSSGRCSEMEKNAQKSVTHWTLCSAKMETLLQMGVQTLPRAPQHNTDSSSGWRAHRDTQGSPGSPANPFPAIWAGTGFTKFCNIFSVSVTAKTQVQPKCCPEHLSEWVFCIWTLRFGPFWVSLGHPFSVGPTQGTLGEQKRL